MSGPAIRVAQLVTTLAVGGAQATVLNSLNLADAVGSDGPNQPHIEVTVLSGGCGRFSAEPTFWGDPRLEDRAVEVPRLVRRISPINDVLALVWLVRWLRHNRPDVLHTHSSKAGVLGRIAAFVCRIPCAHTIHGWGLLTSRRKAAGIALQALERILASLCSELVVVGQRDLQVGLQRRIGRPKQYRVIRSGVDLMTGDQAIADRSEIRNELVSSNLTGSGRPKPDVFVVGMVARMAPPKDHVTLIEAFRRADIAGSQLVLIGDGPARPKIEQTIERNGMGERVCLLGSRADAARLVAGFDVSVLSSRWEGMPRAVVEAAAAGVPIVASNVGSVSDLVEDGVSGRLIGPGDIEALSLALRDAYRDRSSHQRMAAAAKSLVVDFSVQKMRDDLARLWTDLAGVDEPLAGPDRTNDLSQAGASKARFLAKNRARSPQRGRLVR